MLSTPVCGVDSKNETVAARLASEFDAGFTAAVRTGADGLIVGFGQPFTAFAKDLGELAMRHRVPAISESPEFVRSGSLLSYSGNREDAFRLAGRYVGRILKGEKPADMPVQAPTKFELVINLRTAKALGLTVPPALLTSADEVIE
jgi:putative ABC transport system substrate-binding protein